ncbi:hypothetical protein GJAV_G00251960 [Gymnothorax javanicus]|nr:hypothetical protein GJAV_G00251960 [Gymnothorax javanicus]
MGTGEGKSVVVAMFAALRALRGEKVDVISSSPVLCQRDAEECADFFSYFGLTVDTNTTKTKDTDRKKCYEKDIIYGTVETYAADHLRQTFEMKDVRPHRKYECIVIDEVDLLLLDQGIQVTYLSSSMSCMQHLNIILTMIWAHICQYSVLSAGYQTYISGPPASFYKAIFDSMDTDETEINDPMDILEVAEHCNIVPKGFADEIIKSDKDQILSKLKTVSKESQINFFQEIEDYVPYGFTVYALDSDGSLSLKRQGRGTNIKVTKDVNKNGGLFVILSFLADNERVERQAFGRTARKGHPGSAQIIMSTAHLQEIYSTVSTMEEAKSIRDGLAIERIQDMQNDIEEMKLREDLFSEYCKTLQTIYSSTEEDEQKAIVAIMNEFWGIWLQTHSKEIDALKRQELQKSLREDLAYAKKQTENKNSPSSSIYHYVKFGNMAMKEKNWNLSARLFEKATKTDESWAAIAFYNESYCIIKQRSSNYLTRAKDDLKKAQESLKFFSEECLTGLNFIKMSIPKSAKGEPTTLEKQYSTKCNMLTYLDKNIAEAIKKLDEIKGRGRDATAKKAPVFTLVSDTEEELQMETFNLYDRGLRYIFSVEEEPRFPWEALVVFFLGVLQVVAGALLTAFTFGTLAQVGMGLICEGISDCITGVESMITGEFSWESWAIDKAISIGVSLIGFGIGKLVAKGFKVAKSFAKGLSKLKTLPKFFASEAKQGLTTVMKTNAKNALKLTAKKIVEETAAYGIERAENEIINLILAEIEKAVIKGIYKEVKSNMERDPMHNLTNTIVLSHVENKKEFNDLFADKFIKAKLLSIFSDLSATALEPYSADLGWQNQLSASIINVVEGVKEDAKGKTKAILIAVQTIHMGTLAADAVASVVTLSEKYFKGLAEGLEEFRKKRGSHLKVTENDLSSSEKKMLDDFRKEIESTISSLLGKALVNVFHQKFSSHLVSLAQSKANDAIGNYISSGLKTEETEKLMESFQESTHDRYQESVNSGKPSKDHAEKVKNSETSGSPVDINVLSEATSTKVLVITEHKPGKYKTMQEMSPKNQDASQTVVLIYRPKSEKHPDGHYDVLINGKAESVKDGDVYSAMAYGMNPKAKDKELDDAVDDLRAKEAEALEEDPSFWESFITRDEWVEELIVGSWGIQQGTSALHTTMMEKIKNILKDESKNSFDGKLWVNEGKNIQISGIIINGNKLPVPCEVTRACPFTETGPGGPGQRPRDYFHRQLILHLTLQDPSTALLPLLIHQGPLQWPDRPFKLKTRAILLRQAGWRCCQ